MLCVPYFHHCIMDIESVNIHLFYLKLRVLVLCTSWALICEPLAPMIPVLEPDL